MKIEYPVQLATRNGGSYLPCFSNQIPKIVFSVNPVEAAAQALTKIIRPKNTWTSRYEALRWTFKPGYKKMRNPESHYKEEKKSYF